MPPKNIVRKLEITPDSAAERRMKAGGLKNTDHRMKAPTPIWMAPAGSCTTIAPPKPTPISAPSRKAGTTARCTWRSISVRRPAFDPSCTSPCTGMIAEAGNSTAITASITAPPPMPNATVMNDPTKLSAASDPASGQPRPAWIRSAFI